MAAAGYRIMTDATGQTLGKDESLQDIKAAILALPNATQEAADNANAAATAATNAVETLGKIAAETFASDRDYMRGEYVYYSNKMYRFKENHTAGAWDGSEVINIPLGNDVSDLKKSINGIDNYIPLLNENVMVDFTQFEKGNITNSSGSMSYPSSNTRVRTEKGFLFDLKKNTIISLSDYTNAHFNVIYYDKNGTIHPGSWVDSGSYICSEDGDFGIVLEYKDGSTVEMKNDLVSMLQIRSFFIYDDPKIKDKDFWEVGSFSAAGLYTSLDTRCRTRPFRVNAGDIVTVKRETTWACSYAVMAEDGTVLESSDFMEEKKFQCSGIAIVICRKGNNPSATITDALIAEMTAMIKFVRDPFNYYQIVLPKYHGVAHSGGRFGPRNNAVTYANAYTNGFRYAETDVAVTSDGKFVCIHDATINSVARNPDGTEISGDVHVNDCTYAELMEYDFGIAYGEQYAGTKISLFSEVLDVCQKLGMFLYIDFSAEDGYSEAQMRQIMDIVNAGGMRNRVAYVPALMDYVDYILNYDDTAAIGLTRTASQPNHIYRCFTGKNAVFQCCQYGTITAERIETFRGRKIPMEAYTIDDSTTLEGLSEYITGVVSDDICAEKYWEEKLTESGT